MGQLAEFAGNHPYLVLGLFGAWGAVMFYELKLKAQGITQVSATDAVKLINKGAIVVDVRNIDAYETGHIVNARNIPLAGLPDKLLKHKKKVLLTVCDTGTNSGKAVNLLRKTGCEKVFSLKDGLRGWQGENYPLVK